VAVVDDLVAHIDRRAELLDGPLDDLDRPVDAGAEAARTGQDHAEFAAAGAGDGRMGVHGAEPKGSRPPAPASGVNSVKSAAHCDVTHMPLSGSMTLAGNSRSSFAISNRTFHAPQSFRRPQRLMALSIAATATTVHAQQGGPAAARARRRRRPGVQEEEARRRVEPAQGAAGPAAQRRPVPLCEGAVRRQPLRRVQGRQGVGRPDRLYRRDPGPDLGLRLQEQRPDQDAGRDAVRAGPRSAGDRRQEDLSLLGGGDRAQQGRPGQGIFRPAGDLPAGPGSRLCEPRP
jgi:hypothetical protein